MSKEQWSQIHFKYYVTKNIQCLIILKILFLYGGNSSAGMAKSSLTARTSPNLKEKKKKKKEKKEKKEDERYDDNVPKKNRVMTEAGSNLLGE